MSWIHSGNLKHKWTGEEWTVGMNLWESWGEFEREEFLSQNKLNVNYASHEWDVNLPHTIMEAVIMYKQKK